MRAAERRRREAERKQRQKQRRQAEKMQQAERKEDDERRQAQVRLVCAALSPAALHFTLFQRCAQGPTCRCVT